MTRMLRMVAGRPDGSHLVGGTPKIKLHLEPRPTGVVGASGCSVGGLGSHHALGQLIYI